MSYLLNMWFLTMETNLKKILKAIRISDDSHQTSWGLEPDLQVIGSHFFSRAHEQSFFFLCISAFLFFWKFAFFVQGREKFLHLQFKICMFLSPRHAFKWVCFFWSPKSKFPGERIQFAQLEWGVHHDPVCHGQGGWRRV